MSPLAGWFGKLIMLVGILPASDVLMLLPFNVVLPPYPTLAEPVKVAGNSGDSYLMMSRCKLLIAVLKSAAVIVSFF